MIKIYRKIYPNNQPGRILIIELGKYWSIEFTREFKADAGFDKQQGMKEDKGFTRYVKEGAIIPRWYGFTRRDFDRDVSIYQPIPINLIVTAWHWFKWTVVRSLKLEWPQALWQHELEIYHLGKKHGYVMGKYSREAREQFFEIMSGTKDRSVS